RSAQCGCTRSRLGRLWRFPTSSNLPNLHQPRERALMRAAFTVALSAFLATPAAAQWLGEPVWNSPKGGTGVTISGDYARPNSDYGSGNTWGGRASLGIGTLTLTAGVARWKPDLATEGFTSIGGNAAFRLIGGREGQRADAQRCATAPG